MEEWIVSGESWVWGSERSLGIVRFMGGDRALEFLNSGARKRGLFLEIVEY